MRRAAGIDSVPRRDPANARDRYRGARLKSDRDVQMPHGSELHWPTACPCEQTARYSDAITTSPAGHSKSGPKDVDGQKIVLCKMRLQIGEELLVDVVVPALEGDRHRKQDRRSMADQARDKPFGRRRRQMLGNFQTDGRSNVRPSANFDSRSQTCRSAGSQTASAGLSHGPSMPRRSLTPRPCSAASQVPNPQPTSSADFGYRYCQRISRMQSADCRFSCSCAFSYPACRSL